MRYNFSKSILSNIDQTYTYSYARNAHQYSGDHLTYNPYAFFEELLRENPFDAFMEMDGFAYKKTKNTLDRYEIPYTPDQDRRARVFYDVTAQMQKERSDYVSMYIDDVSNTGIVVCKDPYVLTTQKTLEVYEQIRSLPRHKQTSNIIYEHKLNNLILKSKEQMNALETCVSNHISCLIGGAGTGKSFVTASIIEQLEHNGLTVSILAPTHKAREALQSKLSKGRVRTIHSFVHKPDECDAIVIDESGMLSTPLFHSLMRSYEGQQLIFVGDKNQLPPIEYGRPFELIQRKFPVAELKDNKRSEAPDIIALGREVLGIPQNANMPHDNIEIVNTTREAFEKGAEVVLTFTNANVEAVNEEQKLGHNDSISSNFSIGDLIIAKTNQTDRFYNGQLFKIISRDKIKNIVSGKVITIKDPRDLDYNFSLAYGLTIHKSQGSEWNTVAYMPSDKDTQNLAYVAITRAKKKLIIIGEENLKSEYPPEREWKQINEINCI